MRIFLAGCLGQVVANEKDRLSQMKIYCAGQFPWFNEHLYHTIFAELHPFILQSFADLRKGKGITEYLPLFGDFMLDSGAYTFIANTQKKVQIDWERYVDEYAEYVTSNKIQKFFELDIDSVIGYKQVLLLRNRLEKRVGRQAIPVWHFSRGKDAFFSMCKEYKYVAFGGMLTDGVSSAQLVRYLPWFIREAHRSGCKIHGLGFTSFDGLKRCHFDSVDSTAWLSGCRFGTIYNFNGTKLLTTQRKENERMKNTRAVAVHNFREWVKFQKYAETHL